jgi:hypothetical protein
MSQENIFIPAWERWTLTTLEDGRIAGQWETNDNQDRGHETGFASRHMTFDNYERMKSRTGLSHTGISGIEVTVLLDGEKI